MIGKAIRIIDIFRNYGLCLLLVKGFRLLSREGLGGLRRLADRSQLYELWVEKNCLSKADIEHIEVDIEKMAPAAYLSCCTGL